MPGEKEISKAEVVEAFTTLDYSLLNEYFSNPANKKEIFKSKLGITGNALHMLCLLSNPGVDRLFYSIPPLYAGTPIKYKGNPETFKQIIECIVQDAEDLLKSKDSFFKQDPLSTAIGFDNTPAALTLIDYISTRKHLQGLLNGFCIPSTDPTRAFETTPLILAIQKGNIEVFNALLAQPDLKINIRDHSGLSALHWAVIMGMPEMVAKLIEKQAKMDTPALNGKTALDYLEIDPAEFEPRFREETVAGKKVQIEIANSTQDPGFRPIVAHFNNDTDKFLELRAEKMRVGKQEILDLFAKKQHSLASSAPSQTYTPSVGGKRTTTETVQVDPQSQDVPTNKKRS